MFPCCLRGLRESCQVQVAKPCLAYLLCEASLKDSSSSTLSCVSCRCINNNSHISECVRAGLSESASGRLVFVGGKNYYFSFDFFYTFFCDNRCYFFAWFSARDLCECSGYLQTEVLDISRLSSIQNCNCA